METAASVKPSKGANVIQAVATSIVAPLAVVVILGYVSSFNTTNRLVWLVEQQEKRTVTLEVQSKQHDKEYRELQLLLAKHSQIIDVIFKDVMTMKEEQLHARRQVK